LTQSIKGYYDLAMHRTSLEKRTQILHLLCEGNSILTATRIAGVSRNTVLKLLADVGAACLAYQDENLRNLNCERLQCDEVWAYCYAKEKNVPENDKGQFARGDLWVWTAICAESKLIPCWRLGLRTGGDAHLFLLDLADRLKHRIRLTTDDHKAYLDAVEDAFGTNIDYGMLAKMYGNSSDRTPELKYSPDSYTGSNNCFTRLANGVPKKVENLQHALSLHFMYYNFTRIHQSLRRSPAMAAGVTSHLWSVQEIAKLVDGK
jgi:hypothetical protein